MDMTILVIAEHDNAALKPATLNAVAALVVIVPLAIPLVRGEPQP